MNRLLRMARGAILGACLALAVGIGVGGLVLVVVLPGTDPLDQWDLARRILALAAVTGAWVGLIGGAASRASDHGLPLIRSVIVVAMTAIVVMLVMRPPLMSDMFLLLPMVGAMLGGIVSAVAGARIGPAEPGKGQ